MRFALGCAMAAAVGMPAAAIEARALVSKGSAPMTLARALEDEDEVEPEVFDAGTAVVYCDRHGERPHELDRDRQAELGGEQGLGDPAGDPAVSAARRLPAIVPRRLDRPRRRRQSPQEKARGSNLAGVTSP